MIVKWRNNKTFVFVPYANLGYTSCVRQGLKYGKVLVDGISVTINKQGFVEKIK